MANLIVLMFLQIKSVQLRHMLFRENDFSYLLLEILKLYLVEDGVKDELVTEFSCVAFHAINI